MIQVRIKTKQRRPIYGFFRFERKGIAMARCKLCGREIQASGLGIGSHRRMHRRKGESMPD